MVRGLIPEYPGQQVMSGIRALARDGDELDLAWTLTPLARRTLSRYVRGVVPLTTPVMDESAFVDELVEIANSGEHDYMLPFGLFSYYPIAKHQDRFQIPLLVADFDTFELANNKLATAEHCEQIGIACPTTYEASDDGDLRAIAREVRYPAVVKARSGQGVDATVRFVNNADELLAAHGELTASEGPTEAYDTRPLIQEFIPGHIHDACTLTVNGDVLAVVTQVRRLMYPIYGGVGAVNVTTHDPRLTALASKLLESLSWSGPAQVEFKYDPRDGEYKLIEINPKLWGTLDLSIKAGVCFPAMIRDTLLGRTVQRHPRYRAGLRYRFWFSQATMAYAQLAAETSLRALRDPERYEKTFRDFDLLDPIPDLSRAARSVAHLITGKPLRRTSRVPLEALFGRDRGPFT